MIGWVPIFPLPDVVLLPRAVLPLHIFEERYKSMTADALAGDRRIAMARLRPGWQKINPSMPPVEQVICVGRIIEHAKLPDGRYNFLLQGESRVRIVGEERVGLYRVARVEPLVESPTLEIDVADLRERLVKLFTDDLRSVPSAGEFAKLLHSFLSTSDVTDVIGFHLLPDATEKQLLLEETDVRRRIERVVDQMTQLARRLKPPGPAMPPGTSLN